MKQVTVPFILIFTSLLLFACKEEVTGVKLPGNAAKLVVIGFISPDSTEIAVRVFESKPVLGVRTGSTQDLVRNATVLLSDGVKEIKLTPNDWFRDTANQPAPYEYTANFWELPITAGKTYFLKVSVPDGRRVEASCTVPQAYPYRPEVTVEQGRAAFSHRNSWFMRMQWEDVPGELNYYQTAGLVEVVIKEYNGKPPTSFGSFVFQEPKERHFYSDRGHEGEVFTSGKENIFYQDRSPEQIMNEAVSVTLYAYLLHTDRNYYEYHRSVSRAIRSQPNPFAEPVLVYSNVQGGLGVFGAYNRTTVEVKLK